MFVQLNQLAKSFGGVSVLEEFSIALEEGEILALLGPSGSGKTTALRLLAGFETPDRGSIQIAGEDVTALPPAKRGIGMVFQHYALFPHMSVFENVTFGLDAAGWKKPAQEARALEVLNLVDLEGLEQRPVSGISGGQQQRVALARALAPKPRVLLLDEPLSNLDPALRERTRIELQSTVRQTGTTTLLVTHEQDEAFFLGDRVAVLHQGRLEQVGTPEELYHRPSSPFVARFVGRTNILPGTFSGKGVRLEIDDRTWPGEPEGDLSDGQQVDWAVRPEALRLDEQSGPERLRGTVLEKRFTGPLTYYEVSVDRDESGPERNAAIEIASSQTFSIGDTVYVCLKQGAPPPRIFPQSQLSSTS